jgi:EAL domain-containing protein (putative c-di-GMP-specific phosphodiesterase class I)
MMPDEFIPIAEEIGLIGAIGEWVLRTACAEVASWHRVAPLRIAINLSGRQVVRNHISQQVQSILTETGIRPSDLELEITESVLQDTREGVEVLEGLSALGVRLAIDDFGTGYSSLAQLKHLPIDTLKIDQSFIRDIPGDSDGEAITSAIISMAHTLKLKVIAEGVERPEQLRFLQARDCDDWQGNLFSPAVPANEFRQLLARPAQIR